MTKQVVTRRRFLQFSALVAGWFGFGHLIPRRADAALTLRYANFDLATGSNDGTSEANAWQSWATMAAGLAAGHHCYIKRTTARHDTGSATTFAVSGSDTQPVILEGYNTTPGDGGDGTGNANYFLFGSTTAAREISITGNNVKIRFCDFATSKNFGSGGHEWPGNCGCAYRCIFTNANTGANSGAMNADGPVHFVSCRFESAGSATYVVNLGATCLLLGCYVQSTGNGTRPLARTPGTFSNCAPVIGSVLKGTGSANSNIGIELDGTQGDDRRLLLNNSIVDCGTGILIDDVANSGLGRNSIIGNVIYDVDKGIDSNEATTDAGYGFEFFANAIGGATTARYENLGDTPTILPGDVTLTANPWTDDANDDFSLNATAGGGALLVDTMPPLDAIGDGTDVDTRDYGAIQDGS